MRSLVVRLIGRPQIEHGGGSVSLPRGRKSWAVLAYVALAEVPVTRERLASLLFADAADPLGALRWTLAELRRSLGTKAVLRGDPVRLDLPAGFVVDALELSRGQAEPGLVRGGLLEGIQVDFAPVFDAWLLVERRRLAGLCEGVLRDAALAAMAAGGAHEAAALASRALEFSPFEEGLHELLVRCLAAAGDLGAARHAAVSCEVLFRRELGRSPDACVARAADPTEWPGALGDRVAALGQLQAGLAAIDAGAVEPGIACLRMACAEARALGDGAVLARALLELGIALVHAVRGRDEEGAAVLHEALALAEPVGERELVARRVASWGTLKCRLDALLPLVAGWLERALTRARIGSARRFWVCARWRCLTARTTRPPSGC